MLYIVKRVADVSIYTTGNQNMLYMSFCVKDQNDCRTLYMFLVISLSCHLKCAENRCFSQQMGNAKGDMHYRCPSR